MSNPYESPKIPSDANEPPRITLAAVVAFVAGSMVCASLTFLGALATATVAANLRDTRVNSLLVFLCSPAVFAPLFGGIIWALVRELNRPFAVGAITVGVAGFLLIGGCFTLFFYT
jgi:hypothetical protein